MTAHLIKLRSISRCLGSVRVIGVKSELGEIELKFFLYQCPWERHELFTLEKPSHAQLNRVECAF